MSRPIPYLQKAILNALGEISPGVFMKEPDLRARLAGDRVRSSVQCAASALCRKGLVESKMGPGGGYRLRPIRVGKKL